MFEDFWIFHVPWYLYHLYHWYPLTSFDIVWQVRIKSDFGDILKCRDSFEFWVFGFSVCVALFVFCLFGGFLIPRVYSNCIRSLYNLFKTHAQHDVKSYSKIYLKHTPNLFQIYSSALGASPDTWSVHSHNISRIFGILWLLDLLLWIAGCCDLFASLDKAWYFAVVWPFVCAVILSWGTWRGLCGFLRFCFPGGPKTSTHHKERTTITHNITQKTKTQECTHSKIAKPRRFLSCRGISNFVTTCEHLKKSKFGRKLKNILKTHRYDLELARNWSASVETWFLKVSVKSPWFLAVTNRFSESNSTAWYDFRRDLIQDKHFQAISFSVLQVPQSLFHQEGLVDFMYDVWTHTFFVDHLYLPMYMSSMYLRLLSLPFQFHVFCYICSSLLQCAGLFYSYFAFAFGFCGFFKNILNLLDSLIFRIFECFDLCLMLLLFIFSILVGIFWIFSFF